MRLKGDNLDDALADMTAIAFSIYASLIRRGKSAYFTPIMKFACKRYKSGRHFTGESTKDLLAERTKILGRSDVRHFSQFGDDVNSFPFMVDPKANVADSVQLKIDFFDTWYRLQRPKDQTIIRLLAMGEKPSHVARKIGVSPAYITHCRRRYGKSWDTFIADKRETGNEMAA
jgi:hypothetical protein